MGLSPAWNKKGNHNLKRKRRRAGMLSFRKQKHPVKTSSPVISMLGLEAAKASQKR